MLLHNQGNKIGQDALAGKSSPFFVKAFRMPLHTQDRETFMNDCLRAGVMRTILHNMQTLSRFANGLVMGAVDSCIGTA